MQVNGPIKVRGPTEVKEPTEMNFKQVENLSPDLPLPNDDATVDCSTLVLLQIRLAILCF